MISNLLATKLHRPSIPPRRVERPALTRRLNDGLESGRAITFVSAPAGFGKTTCVSQWLDGLNLPVTWLSLDAADNDPGRFFAYLLAALQKIDGSLGAEIEGVLRAGEVPPAEIISTSLVNNILAVGERFLLVLDDLHVVHDPLILQVLDSLVTNAPLPLHLVLLTREEPSLPLARLRANNQLTEIRAADLRFSNQEAGQFLKDVMGLSLSAADVTALEDRTEGWIVGLQLASLSIRDRKDPSAFIGGLSGSHRFILSYLTEEVLSRQPAEIRDFLLQTSILDRLTGDLCNAVTGRSDGHLLLERLYQANLFLIPLDDELRWYRYHQLFNDLLRDRLDTLHSDESALLHLRASRWYAQQGVAQGGAFVSEAIEHALAAEDYAYAVELLEIHALDMLMEWHIKQFDAWMQAIPTEWAMSSPRANLAFAWAHYMRGRVAQAAPYLERLQVMFADPALEQEVDDSLRAAWLALQSLLLSAQGQPEAGLSLAQKALEIVPKDDSFARSQIGMGLAAAYQQLDDYDRTVDAYQMLIRNGREGRSLVSEMLGLSGLALMALHHGQLHFAFEIATQGVERIEHSGALSPLAAAVYGELGQVHYHWHELDQAQACFLRSVQVSVLSGYSDAKIWHGVIQSRLYQMAGDLAASASELQEALDLMKVDAPSQVGEELVAQQVRVYLAQDRLTAAESVLRGEGFGQQGAFCIPDLEDGPRLDRSTGVLYNAALRILLYRARVKGDQAGLHDGIELAGRMKDAALRRKQVPIALETLLLRSKMQAVLGDDRSAMEGCRQALALAEAEGFVSIFVEEGPLIAEVLTRLLAHGELGSVEPAYVQRLLAAFAPTAGPDSGGRTLPAHIEPLSARELDVLRLMAEGLTYKGIAARLYISVNTVRSHVKAIYGKLQVNNRTRALETAHQLDLL